MCTAALAAAWAGGLALLAHADRAAPHDPTCQSWVAVCPGDLRRETIWLNVNLIIVALVLRPWSYRAAAWRRARAAAMTASGLVTVVDMLGQHGGPVTTAHVRALFPVAAALAVLAWLSWRSGRRSAPPAPVVRAVSGAAAGAPAP
ncbi:hypothetical protein tb265_40600 [Gemmatimonadetes bacterium T265]|nr:hypothetical protein tb265_40600 [Gemmatimonadetes bacterium T265]